DHGSCIVVVCSRIDEYRALQDNPATRLHLEVGVTLQPLSGDQIREYIQAAEATGLVEALAEDESLQQLAQRPLHLSMMPLAYGSLPPATIRQDLSSSDRTHHLMQAYTARMVQRKECRDRGIPFDERAGSNVPEKNYSYSIEQIHKYLGWLAT